MAGPYSEDEDLPEPPTVRRLRLLVSALILVLIVGVIVVAATLVIRLSLVEKAARPVPVSAETLSLPAGETPLALGQGGAAVLVWTRDGAGVERLRRFDAATGETLGVTRIERE